MKKRLQRLSYILVFMTLINYTSFAQLAECKQKYLGNIVAGYVPGHYTQYWNAVTAENGAKWGSIERNRGQFNWTDADRAYKLAKDNGFEYRYHAIAWGSQYPTWFEGLSEADSKAELNEYMAAMAARYPDIDQIDVLNENIRTHAPGTPFFRNQLGGAGSTGYDWIVWLFERARFYFPNAKLIINDYGLVNDQSAIREQMAVIAVLKARGLVDGFGTQSHEFNINNLTAAQLKSSLDLMATTGIPIYVTELDISGNDQQQLERYQRLFPVYWNHPDVAGITLWGTVINETWKDNTGLISRDGNTKRPAFNWLVEFMNSQPDVCNTGAPTITITSPDDNSSYESPANVTLTADASDSDGQVVSVSFFDGEELIGTDNSSPFSVDWVTAATGSHIITAVATDNEGNMGEDEITLQINVPQGPYGNTPHPIPGIIQFEEYDVGGNGLAYFDDSPGSEVSPVVNFRTDEDVDIESSTDTGGGYNIGWATAGEWLEYTVNVSNSGLYDIELRVACEGAGRTISLEMDGEVIAQDVAIPNTGGWQTWQTVTVNDVELSAGEQIMRMTIGETDYVNLNYVEFIDLVTGQGHVENSALQYYPNPFSESITLEVANESYYSIINLTGNIVEEGVVQNSRQLGNELDPGFYILSIQSGADFKSYHITKQ